MESVVRHKIVNILETDGKLLSSWANFYYGLNLKISDYISLNNRLRQGNLTHYELFSEILDLWVSANSVLDSTDQIVQKLINLLKDNEYNFLARLLKRAFEMPTQPEEKGPIWFEVGKATRNFVGRTNELKQLKELFNNSDELVVTITGMGGVGKSEIVKNFAKEMSENHSVDCVWLNGESRESLIHSISKFRNFLKILKSDNNGTPTTVDELFADAISTFKSKIRLLVIFDNVDEANEDVQKLISKTPVRRCFFVVTSRNVGVLEYAGNIVGLYILSHEAAMELLKKSDIKEPDAEIKKLCTLLGNFPLALHQAAAYIKMQKHTWDKAYKISEYLKIYESQKRCLLGHKLNQIEHEYKETTLITWNISFERIKKDEMFGSLAIKLLNTIAYFEPDGIQVDFLHLIPKDLEQGIPLLKTYSLVKFEHGVISIHRLIQQVIRLNFNSDQMEIEQLTKVITDIQPLLEPAERFIGLTGYLHPIYYEKSSTNVEFLLKQIRYGMCHIVSVVKHAAKILQLLNNFEIICLETVNNLRYFELYQQIVDLCRATLDQLNDSIGSNTEFKLRIESELAYAQCRLDSFEVFNESKLVVLKAVFTKQLSMLGEEDESTLTAAHYIADIQLKYCYKASKKFNAEALQLCRNVVKLKTKVFGPLHKSTLSTKLVLAMHIHFVEYNKYEAAKLYEECFQWQLTQLGAEGSGTLDIFENYIKCLLRADKHEEARCVVELHLLQKLTHSKHSVYAILSLALFCLGDTEGALNTLRQATTVGNIYCDIPKFDSNLSAYKKANILLRDRSYSEALKIYKEIDKDQLPGFSWRADVRYKISHCLIGLQKFKKGRKVLLNVLSDQRYLGGNNSKPIIEIKKSLADIQRNITAGQVQKI